MSIASGRFHKQPSPQVSRFRPAREGRDTPSLDSAIAHLGTQINEQVPRKGLAAAAAWKDTLTRIATPGPSDR